MTILKRILCLGRVHYEVLVKRLEYLPAKKTVYRPREGGVSLNAGGAGFTTSVVLKRLGHDVSLMARLGSDWQGKTLKELVDDAGLNANIELAEDSSTATNVLAIDSIGKVKYIVGEKGADEVVSFSGWHDAEQFSKEFDWLHIGNVNVFAKNALSDLKDWITEFRERNPTTPISADTTKSPEFATATRQIAECLDFLFCNEIEAKDATEKATPEECCEEFLSLGIKKGVIVKRAEYGAYWKTADSGGHTNAIPISASANNHVVSSGDTFCAGAIDELLHGGSLESATNFANKIAAFQINAGESLATYPKWDKQEITSLSERDASKPRRYVHTRDRGDRFDDGRRISPTNLSNIMSLLRKSTGLTQECCDYALDAGCGTGRFSIPLSEEFDCDVVAVDHDEEMLEKARNKGTTERITWVKGDLEQLDEIIGEHSGKFSLIWVSSVLEEMDILCQERLYRQFFRFLRPGGKLVLRTTSIELLEKIHLFQHFAKGLRYMKELAPSIADVSNGLHCAGFVISSIQLFSAPESVTVEEFVQRLRKRPFPWEVAYSDEEYEECVKEFENTARRTYVKRLFDHRPTYFFIAEKTS